MSIRAAFLLLLAFLAAWGLAGLALAWHGRRADRKKWDRILCLAAIAVALLSPAAASSADLADNVMGPDGLYNVERNLVAAANVERTKHDLKPLEVDPKLQETARRQSVLMCSRGMRHGFTRGWRAENIAVGQSSHREVTRMWMHSSGHRANLLGPWMHCGMAGMRIGNRSISWTQQFR